MEIVKCCDEEIEFAMEGTKRSEIIFCYCKFDDEHEFNQSMCECMEGDWIMNVIIFIAEGFIRLFCGVVASSNDRDECVVKKITSFRRKVEDLSED